MREDGQSDRKACFDAWQGFPMDSVSVYWVCPQTAYLPGGAPGVAIEVRLWPDRAYGDRRDTSPSLAG